MEKGINATIKRISSIALALVLLVGTVFTANFGNAVTADAATETATGNYDEWDGSRSTDFSKGSGTKDDPYIIETAEQLYGVVTSVGGKKTGRTVSAGTTVYNAYDPYYYKVADGITAFYLSGTDYATYDAAKANPTSMKYWNTWRDDVANYQTDGFNGVLDGNGVTIYGMYNPYGYGFIGKFTSGLIKNFNFEACYVKGGQPGIVTSVLGPWQLNTADIALAGISVKNCYIEKTWDGAKDDQSSAAGLVSASNNGSNNSITLSDCFFEARSDGFITVPTSNSSATQDTTMTGFGGMVSVVQGCNIITKFTNCVSLGAPIVDERVKNGVVPDTKSNYDTKFTFENCYTDFALSSEVSAAYSSLKNINRVTGNFNQDDMPSFNWKNLWEMVDGKPVLKAGSVSDTAYSKQIAEQRNGTVKVGANKRNERQGGYADGTYGMYETLNGSGTKDDPYLITNAFELARAIASGGKKITERLYYKLANDIDAANAPWVNTTGIDDKYAYVAFEGELDGAGHTVYNLSATGEGTVGLIPELTATGVVKNLHIRNAYIASTNNGVAGAIAGTAASGAQIDGCSVEDVEIKGTSANAFFGENNGATVTTSYYFGTTDVYYNDKGETFTPAANDLITKDEQGKTWYKGYNGKVRLVNNAKAMTYADITGTGLNQEFGAADAPALMSHLLGKEGYENVYGDVTRNGEVNISDLAALARSQVSNYNRTTDGFWRAVENGEMVIYYAENDNYDAARALELYLEAESGKDIKKVVYTGNITEGTNVPDATKNQVYVHVGDIIISDDYYLEVVENADGSIGRRSLTDAEKEIYKLDGQKQILVGEVNGTNKDSDLGTNDYKINYIAKDAAVAFQGGSFTGIMQAVNEFIVNSNHDKADVYNTGTDTKTLKDTAYEAIDVNGTPYYYVWGDEFDTEGTTNLTENNWTISQFGGATQNETYYSQMENAWASDMSELYDVTDGKLRIWRGYYGTWDGDYTWNTDKTQGYKNLHSIYNSETDNRYGTTEFGSEVGYNENYVSAGLIATSESVLAKRGYLEMKATLPSDGNTFASWWLMGFNGQNSNTSMSNSLYGKVFKLNNAAAYASGLSSNLAWNGSDTVDSSNPATFKYILPQSTFEIDIAEFIQATGRKGTRPNWWSGYTGARHPYAQYNFHKYYRTGVYGTIAADGTDNRKIKFIDWTNTLSTGAAKYLTVISPDTFSYGQKFSTTADEPGLISTVNGDGSPNLSDDNRMETDSSNKYNSFDGTVANKELIYTAEWTDTAIKFQILSADGNRTLLWDNSVDFSSGSGFQFNEATDTSSTEQTFFNSLASLESDKDAMNQYMYMLLDNIYYTMNMSDGLLAQSESTDRTVMEIDYVRIYQQNNRRDVVTPNTQAFNNGNHFGY